MCYETEGYILIGKNTRSNETSYQKVINITSLFTEEAYKGKKLASLILIYAICYLKLFLDIKYFTLDDDSDNNDKIKNIYNSIGFSPIGHVELMNFNNKLKTFGPEKQLLLNDTFLYNANRILNKIKNQEGGRCEISNK